MVGFVIAMEEEARPLLEKTAVKSSFPLSGRICHEGILCGKEAAIAVSGIGKVNAATAAQALISCFPIEVIINIGVAGAVNPGLKICDICVIEKCIQYDFDITAVTDAPVGYIENIGSQYIYSNKKLFKKLVSIGCPATVATADRFSFKSSEADFIRSLGGDLRDMELGAIAQVCHLNKTPFVSIKTVSDTAEGSPAQEFIFNLEKSAARVKDYIDDVMKIITGKV
jgi:adenosylhomocysteine nucleosidase